MATCMYCTQGGVQRVVQWDDSPDLVSVCHRFPTGGSDSHRLSSESGGGRLPPTSALPGRHGCEPTRLRWPPLPWQLGPAVFAGRSVWATPAAPVVDRRRPAPGLRRCCEVDAAGDDVAVGCPSSSTRSGRRVPHARPGPASLPPRRRARPLNPLPLPLAVLFPLAGAAMAARLPLPAAATAAASPRRGRPGFHVPPPWRRR